MNCFSAEVLSEGIESSS